MKLERFQLESLKLERSILSQNESSEDGELIMNFETKSLVGKKK